MESENSILESCETTLAFRLSFVNKNIRKLQGEILTIIDAISEGEKNKAIKDIINNAFSKKLDWFQEVAYTPKNTRVYGVFGYPFEGDVLPEENGVVSGE